MNRDASNPVDSATCACCAGIGRHTPDCTQQRQQHHLSVPGATVDFPTTTEGPAMPTSTIKSASKVPLPAGAFEVSDWRYDGGDGGSSSAIQLGNLWLCKAPDQPTRPTLLGAARFMYFVLNCLGVLSESDLSRVYRPACRRSGCVRSCSGCGPLEGLACRLRPRNRIFSPRRRRI